MWPFQSPPLLTEQPGGGYPPKRCQGGREEGRERREGGRGAGEGRREGKVCAEGGRGEGATRLCTPLAVRGGVSIRTRTFSTPPLAAPVAVSLAGRGVRAIVLYGLLRSKPVARKVVSLDSGESVRARPHCNGLEVNSNQLRRTRVNISVMHACTGRSRSCMLSVPRGTRCHELARELYQSRASKARSKQESEAR